MKYLFTEPEIDILEVPFEDEVQSAEAGGSGVSGGNTPLPTP